MDWQLPLVALSVALSAVYVGRQTWRTWAGGKGGACGGSCGCSKKASTAVPEAAAAIRIIPVEELTLRLRSRS